MAIETTPYPASKTHRPRQERWYLGLMARPITPRDRRFFTERLALLLETGTTLHRSLETLEGQADTAALRTLVRKLREAIGEGVDFSKALARHPQVFSTTYVNLVAASEKGGFLASALKQLSDLETKQAWLRATVSGAFFYPAFLIVFSLAVVVFVLTVVFPKFDALFMGIADQLPLTTRLLMATSEFLNHHWFWLLVAASAGSAALWHWIRHPLGKARIDRMKLGVPVLRRVFIRVYLSQFLRVMGVSLEQGVTVVDALHACRDVIGNQVFRHFMDHVQAYVDEGKGFAAGFQQSTFVPPLVKQMIATGEEAGRLPRVLTRLADFYDDELARGLQQLSKLIEPVMLLVMGVIVGLIVSALVLPIFKMARVAG